MIEWHCWTKLWNQKQICVTWKAFDRLDSIIGLAHLNLLVLTMILQSIHTLFEECPALEWPPADEHFGVLGDTYLSIVLDCVLRSVFPLFVVLGNLLKLLAPCSGLLLPNTFTSSNFFTLSSPLCCCGWLGSFVRDSSFSVPSAPFSFSTIPFSLSSIVCLGSPIPWLLASLGTFFAGPLALCSLFF